MITALLFICAAALGAVLRVLKGTDAMQTAALNIAGSFALGMISEWTSPAFTIVGVGALGSLTTFSSFVAHWVEKIDDENVGPAAPVAFVAVSLLGGVAAAYLGIEIATA